MISRPVSWMSFVPSAVVIIAVTALSAGCTAMGYRVGSSLPPGISVVHVPSLENRTSEPQLELATTKAVMSELQRDGTLSVGDIEKADVVLTVVLENFVLEPLRYERDTATATSEYRLTIRASLELKNRRDGRMMVKKIVKGETDFIPSGDLSSSKRDALPRAAADLAHQIVKSVVEFW